MENKTIRNKQKCLINRENKLNACEQYVNMTRKNLELKRNRNKTFKN